MESYGGWFKVYDKILDWEWFDDSHMVHLFIFLLAKANRQNSRWHGIELRRGQLITSRAKISKATGISEQTVRTCLQRLEETGEIEITATKQFTLITICKYGIYQAKPTNGKPTCNQQPTNGQPTSNQQPTTDIEYKKERIKENTPPPPHVRACEEKSKSDFSEQDFYEELRSDQSTKDRTCMNLHIKPERYDELLEEFASECTAKLITHADRRDYYRHSYDWIRKRIEIITEQEQRQKLRQQKGNSNGSNGHEQLTPKQKFIREFKEKQREDYLRMGVDVTKIQQTADGTDVF
jgi:biotin operon repressor